MTDRWDAARAASKRALRKKYKPAAPIAMSVEHVDTHFGYRIEGVERSYADWALDSHCGSCGYNVCCCDTNRKFSFSGDRPGTRALKVGDVLLGKEGAIYCHKGQVLIVAELDIRIREDYGDGFKSNGIRAYSDLDDKTKLSTWRYGYLRDFFDLTDFGGCRKHSTLWDLSNPEIPHHCTHCKTAESYFQVVAVNVENAPQAKVATAVLNHMADHIEAWNKEMKGFVPSGINSVARGKEYELAPIGNSLATRMDIASELQKVPAAHRDLALKLLLTGDAGKQITATPEQAKALEVPCHSTLYMSQKNYDELARGLREQAYESVMKDGREYRFPVKP